MNKFWKKSSKKFWDIQVWVLWKSSRGRTENVLETSQINVPGRHLNARLGRPLDVFPGRPQDIRSRRPGDGQIGSLGDVQRTLEGRSLRRPGTNIYQLGCYIINMISKSWAL